MHRVVHRAIRPCPLLQPPRSRTCHANFLRCPKHLSSLPTSMSLRRPYSSNGDVNHSHSHEHTNHAHSHENNPHENHSHSHARPSIFGHSHSHNGNGHSHSHGSPDQLVNAFKNTKDRGSQVTLIGLGANIVLTGTKGVAGVVMNSAALLAEAGHSLSDLLGDFVTLFAWKFSRVPPSEKYPYGRGKFEALGSTAISLLLIGGALGIGFHSTHMLSHALETTLTTMQPGAMHSFLQGFVSLTGHLPEIGHSHAHGSVLDPNAAWFAAISVVAKEWLYRITKKVADDENSSVLLANAIHHRSDAYSSFIALVAILGTWLYPAIPLDPIGGIIVSMVIFQQGLGILHRSYVDIIDAGISQSQLRKIMNQLDPLTSASTIHSFSNLRGRSAGAMTFIDVTANVHGALTVADSWTLEDQIRTTLKTADSGITEVNVRFKPISPKAH